MLSTIGDSYVHYSKTLLSWYHEAQIGMGTKGLNLSEVLICPLGVLEAETFCPLWNLR